MTENRHPPSGRRIELARVRRALRVASVAFLALPLFIFAVGWLRPVPGTLLALAIAAAVVGLVRAGSGRSSTKNKVTVSLLGLALGLAPGIALSLLSGAGGLGVRTWDWAKHDAILRDLVARPWPVEYLTTAGPTALVYYVAYYLPAAVAGTLAGWAVGDLALAATSLAGVVIAVLWVVVLAGGAPVRCGWLFTLFSGMDVLGGALVMRWPPDVAALFREYQLEWWTPYWQYSSTPSLVNNVPGQAIAGWLLTAILLDALQSRRDGLPLLAWLALGALWSPFVVVGLLPLAVAYLIVERARGGRAARAQVSAVNLGGALVAGAVALYYASRLIPFALPPRYLPAARHAAAGDFWLVPLALPPGTFLASWALFVACEFGVLWALLLREQRARGDDLAVRLLLVAAGATLLVLPIFHYGQYNDLVMRASIPALYVLVVATAQALRRGVRGATALAIAAVIAIGALSSGNQLRMHARTVYAARRLLRTQLGMPVRNLFQIQLQWSPATRTVFLKQYLGSTDSPFFRWVARPGVAGDVEGPDPISGGAPGAR